MTGDDWEMTSYIKMQSLSNDKYYALNGAFDSIKAAATTATNMTNDLTWKWQTNGGTSTTTDQWIYVYNDPPKAQPSRAARKYKKMNTPVYSLNSPNSVPARRQPPRQFNKYVNGSDLLEEFIAFLGTEGVRQGEVMAIPLELFIKWLIIRACEVDQEEAPVVLEIPAPKPQPRCLGCQRWMRKDTTLPLHSSECADRHFARAA